MAANGLVAQVDGIATLGVQQAAEMLLARRRVGAALADKRARAGVSLRDVAPRLRLTAAALSNIERGASWKTTTVRRVARYYESLPEAA